MTDGPPLTIPFQDAYLLVVDKGAGLVVHPGRGHHQDTLSQLLAPMLAGGEPERAGIVHRLDRDTLRAARRLALAGRSTGCCRRRSPTGQIVREYLALVEGRPPARTGTIEAPIGRDPHVRTRMAVGGASPARGAHPFHARAGARGHLAAAAATRDGSHAPDSRAPAGDRPSCVWRSRVRNARPARPRAPVPARDAPGLRPSDHGRAHRRRLAAPGGPAERLGAGRTAILSGQSILRPVR